MGDLLFNYFENIYSVESFINQIDFKPANQLDKEKLKTIYKKLSSIVIAFDFKLEGPFKDTIEHKFSYEKLLYLCYVKINESDYFFHQNHLFRGSTSTFATSNSYKTSTVNLEMTTKEFRNRLISTENLSIIYFLNNLEDGVYWRELYSVVGDSVLKYLFLYSYIFRSVNDLMGKTYVQVCGCKLNCIYKSLTERKMSKIEQQEKLPVKKETIPETKGIQRLSSVFNMREKELEEEIEMKKDVSYQLKEMGHLPVDRRSILYDKNLGTKISPIFIYSNRSLPLNENTAKLLVKKFILKNEINFSNYPAEKLSELVAMQKILVENILNFITLFRSCPFNSFINFYCNQKEIDITEEIIPSQSRKRKRDERDTENPKNFLTGCIKPKEVFAFVRRCLMHVLGYEDKVTKKDTSSPLLGGKENFLVTLKGVRACLYGLKFDCITFNSLLHGIKFSRVNYLKPISCQKYQRLIFIYVIKWLFEDFIFITVKSYFYATDTSKTNAEIFYYLKSHWKQIVQTQLSDDTVKNYRNLYNLEKIKESDAIGYCSRFESAGVYLGRLLPKNVNNECRIISGCRIMNPCNKKIYQANFKFITLNQCLKWLISNDPNLLGFSAVGHAGLQSRYLKLLELNCLNRTYTEDSNLEPLKKWHFMKFDIQKCFDSIDIKELISYISGLILKNLGLDHVFTVLKYCKIQTDIDNVHLKAKYDYYTLRHHFHEKGFLNGSTDFINILTKNAERSSFKYRKSVSVIYVPLMIHDRNMNTEKLCRLLRKCLNHVIIKIHTELYERVNGILQGSVCSRNLCDLYLGRIENRLFYQTACKTLNDERIFLNKANEILMRVVDDYLVIGSEMERLNKIRFVLREHIQLNEAKTVVHEWKKTPKSISNKNVLIDITNLNDSFTMEKEGFLLKNCSFVNFPWCGFDFDVNTLDIYYNYDKYFEKGNLKNRINKNNDYKHAFISFNLKFLRLFKSNAGLLVTDERINSLQAVLRNFADFFSLSALRFCLLFKTMPHQIRTNVRSQIKLIINLCKWLNNSLRFSLKCKIAEFFYNSISLIKYICYQVYIILLDRLKHSEHVRFTSFIKRSVAKLDFVNCVITNGELHIKHLDELIEQQTLKFSSCKW